MKIIENNRARCDELSELLPKAMIIYGDASATDLLREERIESTDAFISLTGLDEENVMLSCYVGKVSKAKVITKINKIHYGGIIDNFDIGSVVSPKIYYGGAYYQICPQHAEFHGKRRGSCFTGS